MKYPDTLPWWINTGVETADEIYCDKGAIADTWSDVGGDISDKEAVEHAQYIVTACNLLPDLVEVLEDLVNNNSRNKKCGCSSDCDCARDKADELLTKIKET